MFVSALSFRAAKRFLAIGFLGLATLVAGCQHSGTPIPEIETSSAHFPPLSQRAVITKFSFASCSDPRKPQPIWSAIQGLKPDLHVALGDNVYASGENDRPISKFYTMQALEPHFKMFRQRVPLIAIWDDHDYGLNDGGEENPDKEVAKAAFLDFFPTDAKAITAQQQGIYHSFILGPEKQRIQFILLDARWARNPLEKPQKPLSPLHKFQPTQDKRKRILSEEQWLWLESQLRKPAELRFIVSGIQVLPDEHFFEKWGNFPHEKDRLLKLISHHSKKNIFLLSGDRHQGEISLLPFSKKQELVEVTASAINRPSTLEHEANKLRIGTRFIYENFGLANIDWTRKSVTLSIHDIEGKIVNSIERSFQ